MKDNIKPGDLFRIKNSGNIYYCKEKIEETSFKVSVVKVNNNNSVLRGSIFYCRSLKGKDLLGNNVEVVKILYG